MRVELGVGVYSQANCRASGGTQRAGAPKVTHRRCMRELEEDPPLP